MTRATTAQVLAAQGGDREALNEVVRQSIGLAKFHARRFAGQDETAFDEAYSAGLLAVMDAVKHFNPRKSQWGTYVSLWMRARIQRRVQKLVPRELPMLEVDEATAKDESLPDADEALDYVSNVRRLYEVLPKLPDNIQQAVRGRLAELRLHDIGRQMGVSHTHVSTLVNRGVELLRAEFGSEAVTTPRRTKRECGTRSMWMKGCRCDACVEASRAYHRRRRAA